MALPKRRISKTRGAKKRTHKKLTPASLSKCKHCGRMKKPHAVCPYCGYYNGKQVIQIKDKKKEPKSES
jgi:large subunit ribosomal protein L32